LSDGSHIANNILILQSFL